MLRPQQNECRDCQSLDGFWEFQAAAGDGRTLGLPSGLQVPRRIGVPGSWNEQLSDLFNHCSEGWYQKRFFINSAWKGRRIYVNFASVSQSAEVWLNGVSVGTSSTPHLPFEFDVTRFVSFSEENLLVVLADGKPLREEAQRFSPPEPFPFSGIHRSVTLYSVRTGASIRHVQVRTAYDIEHDTGIISCYVQLSTPFKGYIKFSVEGHEEVRELNLVTTANVDLLLPKPRIWDVGHGHLHTLTVSLEMRRDIISSPRSSLTISDAGSAVETKDKHQTLDCYRVRFGIRDIQVYGTEILLNGKAVQFKGFTNHEDLDVLGQGLSHAVIVRDYDLLEWLGGNSLRTSRHAFAEEWLDLADEKGILVTCELQTSSINDEAVETQVMRDCNHPSVIMWSLEKESLTNLLSSSEEDTHSSLCRHQALVSKVKFLDATRPVAITLHTIPEENSMVMLFDVLCVSGQSSGGVDDCIRQLQLVHESFRKPVLLADCCPDAIGGLHHHPALVMSEEFQSDFVSKLYQSLSRQPWFIGAHVSQFADCRIQATTTQAILCRSGAFTRAREPKLLAHSLRRLWIDLPAEKNAHQAFAHELRSKEEEIAVLRHELEKLRGGSSQSPRRRMSAPYVLSPSATPWNDI